MMSKSQRLLSLILMMPDVSCPGGNSLCRLGSPGNRCITNMKMLSPRCKSLRGQYFFDQSLILPKACKPAITLYSYLISKDS